MTPPDCHSPTLRSGLSEDEVSRLRWFGWSVAGVLLCAWAGWISMLALSNGTAITRTTERQQNQYQQLREDVLEIKVILQRSGAGGPRE